LQGVPLIAYPAGAQIAPVVRLGRLEKPGGAALLAPFEKWPARTADSRVASSHAAAGNSGRGWEQDGTFPLSSQPSVSEIH